MTAPLKPWETGSNLNTRSDSQIDGRPSVRFRLPPGTAASTSSQRDTDSPPPIPSRQRNNYNQSYGHGSSSYGGNSYSPYGAQGYGAQSYGSHSYGGYGMGGGGYQSYGMNRGMGYGSSSMAPSTFVRRAEESCQPAFDSVQSIVQAFSSIATMLDSTFFAVHSSFRAVLGVADQFSSLRMHITNTLGAFAIFRGIRYIFRKLMSIFRLRRGSVDSDENDLWSDISEATAATQKPKQLPKSWPIILFFAVVLGTPFLIWKLLQTMGGDESTESWMTGSSEHFEAEAKHDFNAENQDELSVQAGDVLRIAPKHKQPHVRGWLLATVDGKSSGLVPANYTEILGRRKGLQGGQEEDGSNHESSRQFDNKDSDKINDIYEEASELHNNSVNTDPS